jgi:hypothetical protein
MTFIYDAANIHIIFELSHLSALFISNMYEQQCRIYDKRDRSWKSKTSCFTANNVPLTIVKEASNGSKTTCFTCV